MPANVSAEIVIADRPLDTTRDPEQFGNGIVGLGTIRVHGAVRTPTFMRLAAEPLAGQTRLVLAERPAGWKAGDRLVLPDTRQLGGDERGSRYQPQWEELTVAAVSGETRDAVRAARRSITRVRAGPMGCWSSCRTSAT